MSRRLANGAGIVVILLARRLAFGQFLIERKVFSVGSGVVAVTPQRLP